MKLTLPTALKITPEGEKTLLMCRIDLEKIQKKGSAFVSCSINFSVIFSTERVFTLPDSTS